MQEIISILIVATIPVVGIAILFGIVRLCKILSTSQTTTVRDIDRLIQEKNNLTQEKDELTRKIAGLTRKITELRAEKNTIQETTTNKINELTSQNREIQSNLNMKQSDYEDAVNVNNVMHQMNQTKDQQIEDLTIAITQMKEEIHNIPFTYIRADWPFPNSSPAETRRLRTMNYQQFLRTSFWRNRAEAMKNNAEQKCQTCNTSPSGDNPLEVHHRHYRTVGNERPVDLVVLCKECHQLIHNNRPIDGQMRPISDSDC